MRKLWEAAVLFLGTLGWWGFVYPELCLDGEAYEEETQAEESRQGQVVSQERLGRTRAGADFKREEASWEMGWQLGEIRIKSRLVEYVCQIKEDAIEEKRLDDEG